MLASTSVLPVTLSCYPFFCHRHFFYLPVTIHFLSVSQSLSTARLNPFPCQSLFLPVSIPFSTCPNPFLCLSQCLSLRVSNPFPLYISIPFSTCLNPFLCLSQSLSLPVSIPFFACLNPFLCLSQSLSLLVSIPYFACLNPFLCLSWSLSRPVSYKNRRSQEVYLAWRRSSANGRILFLRGEPAPFHWRSHIINNTR
jgi:hypothetical protein